MTPKILIILPCYNEEAILEHSNSEIQQKVKTWSDKNLISHESKLLYVNDGSKDKTWAIIEELASKFDNVLGLKLSKNFGHQNAVLAGHLSFNGQFDAYISIDADLQDDIRVIGEMIEKFNNGAQIVFGVRDDRSSDSFFKRFTAESFYSIMKKMGIPLVFNHADFRLISKRALSELAEFKEANMFLRGIIPTLGFKSDKVFYKRLERKAGESKYPLAKMIKFAWGGITSFSIYPMRLVLWFGIFNFILAVLLGLYSLWSLIAGHVVAGWISTVVPMAYFSGSTMISIGLIGEYVGKIYEEVKARPRYIVEKIIGQ